MVVNDNITVPDGELRWSFVRASGPGGQNVNKVATKAELRWDLSQTQCLPERVKEKLSAKERGRINLAGELIITSQRYRDQERNRQDCLEKLGEMIRQALAVPKPRKRTRPSRASREVRLDNKRRRSRIKQGRRKPVED